MAFTSWSTLAQHTHTPLLGFENLVPGIPRPAITAQQASNGILGRLGFTSVELTKFYSGVTTYHFALILCYYCS